MIPWFGAALAATPPVTSAVEHIAELFVGAVDPAALGTGVARRLEAAFPPALVEEQEGTFVVRWNGAEVARYSSETPSLLAEGLERVVDALDSQVGRRAVSEVLVDGLARSLVPGARLYSDDGPPGDDTLLERAGRNVGLALAAEGTGLRVVDVHPCSDAARAGIGVGDEIVRLDGASATGWPTLEAELRARGTPGKETVEVAWSTSDGAERVAQLALRAPESSCSARGDVAVLRPDLRQRRWSVPGEWWGSRTPPPSSVVLDLRGNPGGSLIEGARLADLFIDDGTLVRTEGRSGPVPALVERVEALHSGVSASVGVVVLVDERTTGAAELATAALLHHQRAVVVGAPTAGRWTVDKVYELGGNLILRLPVARMVVGDRPPEAGIQPDRLLDPRCDGASDPALDLVLTLLADLRRPTRARILEALPEDLPPPAGAAPAEPKEPPFGFEVKLVPAPGGARVEVVHHGPEPLTGVDVHLFSGKGVAVRAEGGRGRALPPGVTWGVALRVEATPVRLRVDVDGYGTILEQWVDTSVPAVFSPPELELQPTDDGIVVNARDPELVGLSVWQDGRKVAWHPSEGTSQTLELARGPMEVRAHDATGLETRLTTP